MTANEICLLALLVGGIVPALVLTVRGGVEDRLIGVDLAASITVFILILFSQVGPGRAYDLVLPLVLVPLSFVGTLVFTRLLAEDPNADD